MCSTFKWVLSAAALAQCDAGDWLLDEQMPFGEVDLLEHSPVVEAHLAERQLTIEQLCEAMVKVSDNSAANLVLHRLGGPLAFTEIVRRWGDAVTRLDRNEPLLNIHDSPQDERDTTSPRAMVHLCQRVLCGDVLLQPSREKLLGWMRASETGLARLRAGLPTHWSVGDKTGTGMRGGVNDVAIAIPPGRKPILIACYMSGSTAPLEELSAVHAEVGRIVARTLG